MLIPLHTPTKSNLRGGLSHCGGNLKDRWFLEHTDTEAEIHAELDVRARPQRGKSSHMYVRRLAEIKKSLLGQVRVDLNLKHRGRNLGIREKVHQREHLKVRGNILTSRPQRGTAQPYHHIANSNVLGESFLHQLLHGTPSLALPEHAE